MFIDFLWGLPKQLYVFHCKLKKIVLLLLWYDTLFHLHSLFRVGLKGTSKHYLKRKLWLLRWLQLFSRLCIYSAFMFNLWLQRSTSCVKSYGSFFVKNVLKLTYERWKHRLFPFLHEIKLVRPGGLSILCWASALGSYSCSQTAPSASKLHQSCPVFLNFLWSKKKK